MAEGKLLVVDDDEDIRELVARILRKEGYQVQTAGDGEEAMALIQREPIDLVVSDVNMPGMDGLSLLKMVKAIAGEIPVVLVTAGGSLDAGMHAIDYGALSYLSKPVDAADLKRVVAYGLAQRKK